MGKKKKNERVVNVRDPEEFLKDLKFIRKNRDKKTEDKNNK